MTQLFSNNGVAIFSAAITSSETLLQFGESETLPTISDPNDYFILTLFKIVNEIETSIEIVIVTQHDEANNTVTVIRGYEGTTQLAFDIGDRAELRLTAGSALFRMLDHDIGVDFSLKRTPSGGSSIVNGTTDWDDLTGEGVYAVETIAGPNSPSYGGVLSSAGGGDGILQVTNGRPPLSETFVSAIPVIQKYTTMNPQQGNKSVWTRSYVSGAVAWTRWLREEAHTNEYQATTNGSDVLIYESHIIRLDWQDPAIDGIKQLKVTHKNGSLVPASGASGAMGVFFNDFLISILAEGEFAVYDIDGQGAIDDIGLRLRATWLGSSSWNWDFQSDGILSNGRFCSSCRESGYTASA